MHICEHRWQMSPGHCRIDGFGLVKFKSNKPVFLNVIVSKNPKGRCANCFFNDSFFKKQDACDCFICQRRSRFDHNSVFYDEIMIDKKEMSRLTRANYLRWIQRRHHYPEYFMPFIEAFQSGKEIVQSEVGNYRFTEKSILKIRAYIAMHASDEEYLKRIKEYPLIYWDDRVFSNSWEDYPVMVTRKEVIEKMEEINE